MAASPASPAPSAVRDSGLSQWNVEAPLHGGTKPIPLALTTHLAGTPAGSVLRTNARRVVQQSAIKELGGKSLLEGAIDHFSMFDKVTALESENSELKSKIRELTEHMNAAVDRAAQAEASLAAVQEAPGSHSNLAAADTITGTALDLQQASNAELITMVRELQQELLQVQQERRKAHNALVEQKGAVRVICRVRPTPAQPHAVRALADGSTVNVSCYGQDTAFNFSRVFGPNSTQQQVYNDVSELVQSSLDGFNVCLMSYGQTGSGKTYSMLGGDGDQAEHKGIIPRAIDKLIESTARLTRSGWQYQLEASCMEIYNSGLRDLLASSPAKEITDMAAIKHDAEGGTSVMGVSRHVISSTTEALALLHRATEARAVNATACNAASSRSHCVFWLHVKGTQPRDGTQLSGALCLVDLAGSERLERSGAQGDRKTETAAINSSLSSLGDVFEALAQKRQHVPYRNSKLTYLLQHCLSRGGKTLFLVHVNPEPASAYESLTSLRFATKVSGTELGQASRKVSQLGVPLLPALSAPVAAAAAPVPAAVVPVARRGVGAVAGGGGLQRVDDGVVVKRGKGPSRVGDAGLSSGGSGGGLQAQHVGRKRGRVGREGGRDEGIEEQELGGWQGGRMNYMAGRRCDAVEEEVEEEEAEDALDLRAALRRRRLQGSSGEATVVHNARAVAPTCKVPPKGAWK